MIRDAREFVAMVPHEVVWRAYSWLPNGVKARTAPSVVFAGTPVLWTVAYAVSRYVRGAVLAVAR